jgi:hypothetical protein
VLAQRRVTYLIDKVKGFQGHSIALESGAVLPADILVHARKGACACHCRQAVCVLSQRHIRKGCSGVAQPFIAGMWLHAEGCEVIWQPAYLKELGLGASHYFLCQHSMQCGLHGARQTCCMA